jgi:hypothetical protein
MLKRFALRSTSLGGLFRWCIYTRQHNLCGLWISGFLGFDDCRLDESRQARSIFRIAGFHVCNNLRDCVAARGPMVHFHPFVEGPRYFFYPFVLMMWASIWIATASGLLVRVAMCAALAFSLIAAGSQLSRRHDVLDWRANLRACALSDHYTLPIQFNRTREDALRASPVMTGEECRKLLARSFF